MQLLLALEQWLKSHPFAQSIVFNIIGGFLTVAIIEASKFAYRRSRRRRFRQVFGRGKSYVMCYGALVLRPDIMKKLLEEEGKFPLTRLSNQNLHFSAERAASACEIRAASYVSSALGRDGGVSTTSGTDDDLVSELNIDFVSFGAMNNGKTLDLFSNDANDLAEYDVSQGTFVRRKDKSPLYTSRPNRDYGIILKIHPKQFPDRVWIACAGIGEWGTSGSAWFLANRWKNVVKELGGTDRFVCVIEVETLKDQSATLVKTISR